MVGLLWAISRLNKKSATNYWDNIRAAMTNITIALIQPSKEKYYGIFKTRIFGKY